MSSTGFYQPDVLSVKYTEDTKDC